MRIVYCNSESNWALINIIEHVFMLSLIVGVILYFMEAPTRRKQAQYDAWRVITSNEGKTGSGGRIQALQDLNKDGVDLSGVDLHKAFLRGISLQQAHLSEADLSKANLGGAHLSEADLSKANLGAAFFSGANLSKADLSEADLGGANLSGAHLSEADLSEAYLGWANLSGANLSEADLSEADLSKANLSGAIGLTQVQVDSAKGSEDTKAAPRASSSGALGQAPSEVD